VSAGAEATYLWSATGDGETLVLGGHAGEVAAVEFSADGSRLITISRDNTVRVWPAEGRRDPLVLRTRSAVHAIAVAPETLAVAIATEDGSGWVWRPDADRLLRLSGHERGVASVALDGSAARVLTGSWDGTARVWDASDGRLLATLTGHTGGVTARFGANGAIATVSDDRTGRVWSGPAFDQVITLVGHTDLVKDAAFNSDGSLVATASFDSTARVWNAADGSRRATFRHRGPVSTVAFHPDGSRLLTASNDSTAAIWSLATDSGQYLRGHEGAVTAAVFDEAGERVVTASKDQTARVWRLDAAADPVILRGHSGQVLSARFSRDGEQVVTASTDGEARVFFSLEERSEPIVLHAGAVVRDAFFSNDGTRVVTVSEDRAIRVWRIGWSELHGLLSSATSACLPPGLRIAHLRESASKATSNYLDCERRHDRTSRSSGKATG
jgi:WD40 repeat protein